MTTHQALSTWNSTTLIKTMNNLNFKINKHMLLELKITADTSQELNNAIRSLANGLPANTTQPVAEKVTEKPAKVETKKAEVPKAEEPAKVEKSNTGEGKEITIEEILALMRGKSAEVPSKRAEAKALLASYGAAKLQDLDTAKYAAFKTELIAL